MSDVSYVKKAFEDSLRLLMSLSMACVLSAIGSYVRTASVFLSKRICCNVLLFSLYLGPSILIVAVLS